MVLEISNITKNGLYDLLQFNIMPRVNDDTYKYNGYGKNC